MKKITLILMAAFAMFSANARVLNLNNPLVPDYETVSYWYDMNTGSFVTDKVPQVDQLFTFAIDITTDVELMNYLETQEAAEGVENTIGIKFWTEENHYVAVRMKKIADGIYGMDMVASQMFANMDAGFITAGNKDANGQLYFIAFGAQIGGDAWWQAAGDFTTPLVFEMDEDGPVQGQNTSPVQLAGEEGLNGDVDGNGVDLVPGMRAPQGVSGIEDVIADSIESGKAIKTFDENGQVVIVKGGEVFSILGAKIK